MDSPGTLRNLVLQCVSHPKPTFSIDKHKKLEVLILKLRVLSTPNPSLLNCDLILGFP